MSGALAGSSSSGKVSAGANEEELELLLPWGPEQRLAACLNPCKIPLIILVMIFGSCIEEHINDNTQNIWYAPTWQAGPQCYVHQVPEHLSGRATLNREVHLNSTGFTRAVILPINATLSALGIQRFRWHQNVTLGFRTHERRCGVVEVIAEPPPPNATTDEPPRACAVNDDELEGELFGPAAQRVTQGGNGMRNTFMGVHVPFCIIWGLYKLVFLPIYWIDYLCNRLAGERVEPTFRLIAAPHFRSATTFMNGVMMLAKTFTYSLMPNNLIIPLVTLKFDAECPTFLRYSWSYYTSAFIYWWAILILVRVTVVFIVGKTVLKGRCVGHCLYRVYKTLYILSVPLALTLWLADTVNLMEWDMRYWFSFFLSVTVDIRFDFVWGFTVDLCRLCASFVWLFDTLQFWILVLTVVCPKLAERLGDKLPGGMGYARLGSGSETSRAGGSAPEK